jgi:hypothetical protein
MRTLLTLLLVLAVIAGAIWLYLIGTTPKESVGVKFPLTADQRALIERVPASADSFALLPTAGPLKDKLLANPVTRGPFEQWSETYEIPSAWMLGGADVVAWRDGKRTSYAIRLDTVRAFLTRIWMMWTSDVDARWDGTAFVINGHAGPRIQAASLEPVLELARGLPPGDVFIVQRNRVRGVFPPIGRPAVSSVKITEAEITSVSRAAGGGNAAAPAGGTPAFPKGAMLAATFQEPPRILADLERLTGTDVTALVAGGGSIVIYDVDTGTLLPRPKGLISVPADARRRAAMGRVNRIAEVVGQSHDSGKELLVAFDRTSIPLYLKDAFEPGTLPATSWAVRIDPPKLVPVLQKAGDSTGLRLASGRLHRAARDLRRWIAALEHAKSIEAAASTTTDAEELRVRIASK